MKIMRILIHGFIPLICLVSLTTTTPITMYLFNNNNGRHFTWPSSYGQWSQIERSDQSSQTTSPEGYSSNDYGSQIEGGFAPSMGHLNSESRDDYPNFASYDHSAQGEYESHQNLENNHVDNPVDNHHVHAVQVSEHVEVTKPVAVPVYKEIGVPVPQPVKINVPYPVAIGVPQPYPVAVPVSHPVPIQIIKTIAVPVERKVPYPVEKHIPVPVEKPVPIHIERHIPVPVEKPYPIKIPIYKTIYHHIKSHSHK